MPTINNTYGRIETAEMIASAAMVFVRKARAEGYANTLTTETIDGVAAELGIRPSRWTWSTVVKIVKANAALMDETHLLELDPAPAAESAQADENPGPATAPASAAPTYANVRRHLGKTFKVSVTRKRGQVWNASEGVTVRTSSTGVKVGYTYGTTSWGGPDEQEVRRTLDAIRACLEQRWTVADDPYPTAGLIVTTKEAPALSQSAS